MHYNNIYTHIINDKCIEILLKVMPNYYSRDKKNKNNVCEDIAIFCLSGIEVEHKGSRHRE